MMMLLLLSTGILAFSTGQNVFFLLFSLLAASILVSSVVNRLMLAGLRLELDLPAHVCAGQSVDVQLSVRNTKEWITTFALQMKTADGRSLAVAAIEPLGRFTASVPFLYPRRGYPPAQVIDLSTRFPFGFSTRITRVQVLSSRPVYPSIQSEEGFSAALSAFRHAFADHGLRGNQDFSHLRDYQAGDSLKQVAWAASARRDSLLVKTFFNDSTGEAALFFDRSSPDFERLVHLAAFAVWELHFQGEAFVFLSDEGQWPVRDTMEAYAVLRYLALVEAATAPVQSSFPSFPVAALLSFRNPALVLARQPNSGQR